MFLARLGGLTQTGGDETFDLSGIDESLKPQQYVTLTITRRDGSTQKVQLLRIDTPIEVDYYRHGGILPFVLRELNLAVKTKS